MVDSIRNQQSRGAAQSPKAGAPKSESPNSESLRSGFKSLSSGLNVQRNVAAADTAPAAKVSVAGTRQPAGDNSQRVVQNLKEAVSYSALALKSIEGVVGGVGVTVPPAVQELTKDLQKLRDSISGAFDELRSKADTAEVISENYASSEVRLSDVESAQAQAAETGAQINFKGQEAIKAHTGLSPAKVASLLAE